MTAAAVQRAVPFLVQGCRMVYQDDLPAHPEHHHHHCFWCFFVVIGTLSYVAFEAKSQSNVRNAQTFAKEPKVELKATILDAGYEDSCSGMFRKCASGYEVRSRLNKMNTISCKL